MNFNNKYFQIKNFHLHVHAWKHEFTYESSVFTERYYKCQKCPRVISKISGYLAGSFREKTTISSIEIMNMFRESQEIVKKW